MIHTVSNSTYTIRSDLLNDFVKQNEEKCVYSKTVYFQLKNISTVLNKNNNKK